MPYKPNEREYRNFAALTADNANQDNEQMLVRGYASTYQPYVLYEAGEDRVIEEVDPHAFDGADISDVIMQYDHAGRVFARTKNGSLQVTPDEHGLLVIADLSGSDIARGIYSDIRSGLIDSMSFGFIVKRDSWNHDEVDANGIRIHKRRILEFKKIFDVSVVSLPANPTTEINTYRNLCEGVIQEFRLEQQKRENDELEAAKLAARIRAILLSKE